MKHQCVTASFPTRRGEPPPGKANAAQSGKDRGGAAKKAKKRTEKQNGYRPRPCLLQVGGAR
jgi:hypothetical protein